MQKVQLLKEYIELNLVLSLNSSDFFEQYHGSDPLSFFLSFGLLDTLPFAVDRPYTRKKTSREPALLLLGAFATIRYRGVFFDNVSFLPLKSRVPDCCLHREKGRTPAVIGKCLLHVIDMM